MDVVCGRAAGDGDPEGGTEDPAFSVDRELQAAIEYKIALSGIGGVERILEFVAIAIRRQGRPGSLAKG